MQQISELRNRLVHGYGPDVELNPETVEFVLGITDRLLSTEYTE
jgi:hypothetical protein